MHEFHISSHHANSTNKKMYFLTILPGLPVFIIYIYKWVAHNWVLSTVAAPHYAEASQGRLVIDDVLSIWHEEIKILYYLHIASVNICE